MTCWVVDATFPNAASMPLLDEYRKESKYLFVWFRQRRTEDNPHQTSPDQRLDGQTPCSFIFSERPTDRLSAGWLASQFRRSCLQSRNVMDIVIIDPRRVQALRKKGRKKGILCSDRHHFEENETFSHKNYVDYERLQPDTPLTSGRFQGIDSRCEFL